VYVVGDSSQPPLDRTGVTYALWLRDQLTNDEELKFGKGSDTTREEYKKLKRHTAGMKRVAERIAARGERLQPLWAVLVECEEFLAAAEDKKWHRWSGRISELSELIATALACYSIDEIKGCGGIYGDAISGGDASRSRGGMHAYQILHLQCTVLNAHVPPSCAASCAV
jgi:hypothetical protein